MSRPPRAFTLIELLLVISIIVLLMALLAPAMSGAIVAVKVRDTDQRIALIARAVEDYCRVYHSYPIDITPDRFMDPNSDASYPQYVYPDGSTNSEDAYLFKSNQWLQRPYGGKLLAYFLMGPYGTGWHRPKNPASTADPFYRCKSITAEWDVPLGLPEYLENKPVGTGCSSAWPGAVFVDAFGLEGSNGGTIGYLRADPRKTGPSRWTAHNGPMWPAFYNDCRTFEGGWGDDQGVAQLEKILAQCPGDFMLISPGPDRKFGYRVYVMTYRGETRKSSFSSLANGTIDDRANFPLK